LSGSLKRSLGMAPSRLEVLGIACAAGDPHATAERCGVCPPRAVPVVSLTARSPATNPR